MFNKVQDFENRIEPLPNGGGFIIKSEIMYVFYFHTTQLLDDLLAKYPADRYYIGSKTDGSCILYDRVARTCFQIALEIKNTALIVYPFHGCTQEALEFFYLPIKPLIKSEKSCECRYFT